jgi:hypothetical protein
MKLVSENSAADLARRRGLRQVHQALQEMTANLMRISRGGGKPQELVRHVEMFAGALVAYHEGTGEAVPAEEFAAALSVSTDPEFVAQFPGPEGERLDAIDTIIHGALQVAASRLLQQRTHETVGSGEMHEGIRALRRIHDEARKEARAATRAQKPAAARKKPGAKRGGAAKVPRAW